MATPDKNDPGRRIVIVQSAKSVSPEILHAAVSQAGIVLQLLREVMDEVPDADLIEIRAIRYDAKEDTDERSVSGPPAGE